MPKTKTKGILKRYKLRKQNPRCKFKTTVKVCKFYKDNSLNELAKRVNKNNIEEITLKD